MSTNVKRSTVPKKNIPLTSKPSGGEIDDNIGDLGDDRYPAKPKPAPRKAKSVAENFPPAMRNRCGVDKIRLAFPVGGGDVDALSTNFKNQMATLKNAGISQRMSSTGKAYRHQYLLDGDGGKILLLAQPKSSTSRYFLEAEFSFSKVNAGDDIRLLRDIINATYYEHAAEAFASMTILSMELAVDIDRPFSSLLFGCKNKHAFEAWGKSTSSSAESILFGSRDSERYATVYDLQAAELDDLAYTDLLKYRKNKQLPADFDEYYPKPRLSKPRQLEAKALRNKHTMPESTRIEFRAAKLKLPLREADSFTMKEITAIQIFDAGNFADLCKTLEQKLFLELARCMGVSAAMSKLDRNDKERFSRLLDQAKLKEWEQIDIPKLMAKALRDLQLAFTQ